MTRKQKKMLLRILVSAALMAMLLAVAGVIADAPITVHGVESLNKSWPGFLGSYEKLKV